MSQSYIPLDKSNLKKQSYDVQSGNNIKGGGKGGIIAIAIVTTLAVIALLVVGAIAIVWAVRPKKSNSVRSSNAMFVKNEQDFTNQKDFLKQPENQTDSSSETSIIIPSPIISKDQTSFSVPIYPTVDNLPENHQYTEEDVEEIYNRIKGQEQALQNSQTQYSSDIQYKEEENDDDVIASTIEFAPKRLFRGFDDNNGFYTIKK